MHTPGPWEVLPEGPFPSHDPLDNGGYRIDGPGIEQIAYVWNSTRRWVDKGDGPEFGTRNGAADAYLIAAAPDLYEALRDLCASGGPDDGGDVFEKAKAALAKARGDKT